MREVAQRSSVEDIDQNKGETDAIVLITSHAPIQYDSPNPSGGRAYAWLRFPRSEFLSFFFTTDFIQPDPGG